MSMDGGVMRMRPLAGGLALPAHGEASLQPGGNHLMLIGPTAPIVAGGSVSVTLRFKKAGEVTLTLPVRAAEGAADEHSHHHEGAGS